MIHDFHYFHESIAFVVLVRKFMLKPQCFSTIFFELFHQLLRIVEEQNSTGLFNTGSFFKNIRNTHQSKGGTISLTHLYYFHPPHRDLDISRVITVDS